MTLTSKVFSEQFKRAFNNTWQAIGPDALAAMGADEGSMDARDAAETVLDANRMEMYGGLNKTEEAEMVAERRRLIDEHGYDAVLGAAAELI